MDFNHFDQMAWSLAFEGKGYYEIERELLSKSQMSEMPKELMNNINNYLIDFQLASQAKEKALTQVLLGTALLLFGIGITLFSFFRGSSQYIFGMGSNYCRSMDIKRRI